MHKRLLALAPVVLVALSGCVYAAAGLAIAGAGFAGYGQDKENARRAAIAAGTGTLRVSRDGTTCRGQPPLSIAMLANGAVVGNATLAPGAHATFTVQAGTYALSAKPLPDGPEILPRMTGAIPVAGEIGYTLTCRRP
jgi:hypothetical protein